MELLIRLEVWLLLWMVVLTRRLCQNNEQTAVVMLKPSDPLGLSRTVSHLFAAHQKFSSVRELDRIESIAVDARLGKREADGVDVDVELD